MTPVDMASRDADVTGPYRFCHVAHFFLSSKHEGSLLCSSAPGVSARCRRRRRALRYVIPHVDRERLAAKLRPQFSAALVKHSRCTLSFDFGQGHSHLSCSPLDLCAVQGKKRSSRVIGGLRMLQKVAFVFD